MKPYWCAEAVTLYLGDCIEVMRTLPEASVDAVVTDPPYGLEFMGEEWDRAESPRAFQAWCEAWAREAYRVLKPGGHLVAFGGTRTHHRLVCGIEDAGFEIRDELDYMFGSGFPKSLDVSKAIDRAAGAEREVIGQGPYAARRPNPDVGMFGMRHLDPITAPATDAAREWQGWGTGLKPAHEPICLARKPLAGTVAQNVLAYGTGALNIDGTRIGTDGGGTHCANRDAEGRCRGHHNAGQSTSGETFHGPDSLGGRWPANVILDEEAAALLDATIGESTDGVAVRRNGVTGGVVGPPGAKAIGTPDLGYGGRGGPSRYFYTAKASRSEREAGLEDMPVQGSPWDRDSVSRAYEGMGSRTIPSRRNAHPTVKPIDVMRWLVRLVTPPGGTVLDPFLGSGTTGLAALDVRMWFIGIDMTERYVEIARYRLSHRHLLEDGARDGTVEIPQGRLL